MPIRLFDNRTLEFEQNGGNEDLRKLKYGEGSIMLRTRRNKDGTLRRFWQGRFFADGRQRSVYGRTQAECIEKLKKLKEDYNSNQTPIAKARGASLSLYSAWLDEWLNEIKKSRVRPDYFEELKVKTKRVKSALGGMRLARIRPADILKFVNSLAHNNTAVKLYDIVNGSLQKAEDFGYIKHNPCKAVERPLYSAQERRAFELKEQAEILAALEGKHRQAFFFLCCTGLRIGEFLALQKTDIDFLRCRINVAASRNARTGTLTQPKTAAGKRYVTFAPQLFETFDVELLGTFTYSGIKKAFSKVYNQLGIKNVSLTHSCRHTFASMLYAAGVPGKVIQGQLGHAAISTTMDIYTDILLAGESPIYNYISALKEKLESIYLGGR